MGVEIYLSNWGLETTNIDLFIYEGAEIQTDLHDYSYRKNLITAEDGWFYFNTSEANIQLDVNEIFVIGVLGRGVAGENGTEGYATLGLNYVETYSEGSLYNSHGHPFFWVEGAVDWEVDLAFRTYVSQVPVPAAVWLFGSALIGLAGLKRKK